MALKGTATIELTNADGSKEIIKHDNMITNAVRDLFITKRGENPPLFQVVNNNDRYAKALFGGVLLFDDTLDEDADNYYIPSTKIVGYASQDAYAGLDIARGSFNASEGGLQEDGSYKFVWDFATSQGNGVIKALALCPNMMGQIGASDSIVSSERKEFTITNKVTAPFADNGYTLSDASGAKTDGISNWCFQVVAVIGDIAYALDCYNIRRSSSDVDQPRYILNNGGILKLYKFKLGLDSISVADKVCMSRYIGCDDIQLPAEFTSLLYAGTSYEFVIAYSFDNKSGTLIVFPCYMAQPIKQNAVTKYVEIQLKNGNSTIVRTFTNTTAGSIGNTGCSAHYGGMYYNFYIGKDYILAMSKGDDKRRRLYVINKQDNTDVKPVLTSSGSSYYWTSDSTNINPLYACDNILVFAIGSSDDRTKSHFILDLKTGIIKETNANKTSSFNNVDLGDKVAFGKVNSYLGFELLINPFVLSTKNNLDNPVTKTASQTMKITYTLTESEE